MTEAQLATLAGCGTPLRQEFTDKFLLPSGEWSEDESVLHVPRDDAERHAHFREQRSWAYALDEAGAVVDYLRTDNRRGVLPAFAPVVDAEVVIEPVAEPVAEPIVEPVVEAEPVVLAS